MFLDGEESLLSCSAESPCTPRVQLGYVDNEGIGHDVPRVAQCQWVYGVKYVQRGPAL